MTVSITLALTNATGRQAASLARVASAVGFNIAAHITSPKYSPHVARELADLPRVTIHQGSLADGELRKRLFAGADIAFVNTTTFDDELEDGKACIDAAKAAGVKHVVYSSMPDHSMIKGKSWQGLPHWAPKWHVEQYARSLDLPVTFVYTGIYHNNFTSLPYPLFCLKEVSWEQVGTWDGDWESDWVPEKDGEQTQGRKCGFEWQAPFPTDLKLPWLDCEHDFGPAVLQIFKHGPEKWAGHRVPLAFSLLDPVTVCEEFSRGLNRPVRFVEGPVEISVPVPKGYRGQLEALQGLVGDELVGGKRAPFWPEELFEIDQSTRTASDYGEEFEIPEGEGEEILRTARKLWGGWRSIEGYAREAFVVEERLNGMTWMDN